MCGSPCIIVLCIQNVLQADRRPGKENELFKELLAWESHHQVNFALALQAVINAHNDFFEEPSYFLRLHIEHANPANDNPFKGSTVAGARVRRLHHLDNDNLSLFRRQMSDCEEQKKAKSGTFYPVNLILNGSLDDRPIRSRWISVRLQNIGRV